MLVKRAPADYPGWEYKLDTGCFLVTWSMQYSQMRSEDKNYVIIVNRKLAYQKSHDKMNITFSLCLRYTLSTTALFIDSPASIPIDKEISWPYNAHITLETKDFVFPVAMVIIKGSCKPDFHW